MAILVTLLSSWLLIERRNQVTYGLITIIHYLATNKCFVTEEYLLYWRYWQQRLRNLSLIKRWSPFSIWSSRSSLCRKFPLHPLSSFTPSVIIQAYGVNTVCKNTTLTHLQEMIRWLDVAWSYYLSIKNSPGTATTLANLHYELLFWCHLKLSVWTGLGVQAHMISVSSVLNLKPRL